MPIKMQGVGVHSSDPTLFAFTGFLWGIFFGF